MKTSEGLTIAGTEAATSLSHKPNATGVSASTMLLGQRLKLHGEQYANGEPDIHP